MVAVEPGVMAENPFDTSSPLGVANCAALSAIVDKLVAVELEKIAGEHPAIAAQVLPLAAEYRQHYQHLSEGLEILYAIAAEEA